MASPSSSLGLGFGWAGCEKLQISLAASGFNEMSGRPN